jgi:putative SOS response-associated peptidase YedK
MTVSARRAHEATIERRDVRPTIKIAVIQASDDGARRLEAVRWGIQPEWSKRPLLNARADKLDSGRTWKRLASDHTRRVLFVADGRYEC